jgi:SAM-dependent methyltransferase
VRLLGDRVIASQESGQTYSKIQWLQPSELSALEFGHYWNDSHQEKSKQLDLRDDDCCKVDRFMAEAVVVKQLRACLDFMQTDLSLEIKGLGADLASGNLWAVPILLSESRLEKIYCVEYSWHRIFQNGPKLLRYRSVPVDKAILCLGNFYDIKLPDQSLDFVLLSEAFHHAARPRDLLLEIKRLLKNSGAVVIIGERPLSATDLFKYSAKFFASHLIPRTIQQRLTGRSIFATTPFPRGQILIDPELGDHGYTLRQYHRLFNECGFTVHQGKTEESDLHWFILVPQARRDR